MLGLRGRDTPGGPKTRPLSASRLGNASSTRSRHPSSLTAVALSSSQGVDIVARVMCGR